MLNAVFVLSAATGLSALFMKLADMEFSMAGDLQFWAVLVAVCVFVGLLPVDAHKVAAESDRRLSSRALFSAVTSLAERDSRYADIIFEDAAAVAAKSSAFGAVRTVDTRLLPIALAGALLGLLAVAVPSGPTQTRDQILAQLLEKYKVELVQGGSENAEEALPDEVQEVLEERFSEIAEKVEKGDLQAAIQEVNEVAQQIRKDESESTDSAARSLEEAGFSPEVASQLATGTFEGTMSAQDLEKAANAVSGARAASLAEAAQRVASGEEASLAIESAMREARRLARTEDLRDRLRAMLVDYGDELFAQLTPEQQKELMALLDEDLASGTDRETAGAGKAVGIRKDMLQQVSNARYPLEYRLALFDYYSPDD